MALAPVPLVAEDQVPLTFPSDLVQEGLNLLVETYLDLPFWVGLPEDHYYTGQEQGLNGDHWILVLILDLHTDQGQALVVHYTLAVSFHPFVLVAHLVVQGAPLEADHHSFVLDPVHTGQGTAGSSSYTVKQFPAKKH